MNLSFFQFCGKTDDTFSMVSSQLYPQFNKISREKTALINSRHKLKGRCLLENVNVASGSYFHSHSIVNLYYFIQICVVMAICASLNEFLPI